MFKSRITCNVCIWFWLIPNSSILFTKLFIGCIWILCGHTKGFVTKKWLIQSGLYVIKKNPTRYKNISKFYYSIFIWRSTCFGLHTTHHQEPKTALAASGFFIRGRLFGRVIGGHCQGQCAVPDNVHQLHHQLYKLHVQTTFHVWKTRGCQCSFRLLMMGGV